MWIPDGLFGRAAIVTSMVWLGLLPQPQISDDIPQAPPPSIVTVGFYAAISGRAKSTVCIDSFGNATIYTGSLNKAKFGVPKPITFSVCVETGQTPEKSKKILDDVGVLNGFGALRSW